MTLSISGSKHKDAERNDFQQNVLNSETQHNNFSCMLDVVMLIVIMLTVAVPS